MLGEGVDLRGARRGRDHAPEHLGQVVRPTLMDREGGALLISTPRGLNYFYKAFKRGQDPQDPGGPPGSSVVDPSTCPRRDRGDAQGPPRPSCSRRRSRRSSSPKPASSSSRARSSAAGEAERPRGAGDRPRQDRRLHGHLRGHAATRRTAIFERFQDVTWPRQCCRIIRF